MDGKKGTKKTSRSCHDNKKGISQRQQRSGDRHCSARICWGGYFLAVDWAAANRGNLDNPGDYVNAAVSALNDKPYMHNLWGRLKDSLDRLGKSSTPPVSNPTPLALNPSPAESNTDSTSTNQGSTIETSNALCGNRLVLNTFIRHANEDITSSNKIVSITQPSANYIKGLHDWECRGFIAYEDGTASWSRFGHHPVSSSQYEVFIDEE
jgi:hypothetical protein